MQRKTGSLYVQLFWAFALVTVIAAALPALALRGMLYSERIDLAGREALSQAALVRCVLENWPEESQVEALFRTTKSLGFRMTLTGANGVVLRDSHIGERGLPELDNHADRPEIEAALAGGFGISLRYGDSLGMKAVYGAVPLSGGGVLRVAVPLATIRSSLSDELLCLGAVAAGAVLLCLGLAALFARRLRRAAQGMAESVESIARVRGHHRLRQTPWREFLPLARAVNHMADSIEDHIFTITDQRHQLETILDSLREGVLVLGTSGRVRRWNSAMTRLFPQTAQARGKALVEAVPVPALQDAVDKLPEAGTMGTPGDPIHFEMPRGRFLVGYVTRPAMANDTLGAVVMVYDVTEIMRLEEARRDFVANVSHELRTPLTAIAGYAETLCDSDDLRPEYRRFAGIIHKHATALAGVIEDLLELARIQNTTETVPLTPVTLEPVIAEATAACRLELDRRGLTVAVNTDGVPVLADAALLTRVFRNLLENACRYSPEGDSITVSARQQGDEVLMVVADNGPGIPAQALPRIFERFYQVNRERNSGTSGIGLAICKNIVQRLHGRIWAESPRGDAATAMLITLPAALPNPESTEDHS